MAYSSILAVGKYNKTIIIQNPQDLFFFEINS